MKKIGAPVDCPRCGRPNPSGLTSANRCRWCGDFGLDKIKIDFKPKMTVKAEKSMQFDCEKCGHLNYGPYTLCHGWYGDRAVMEDKIDCSKCGHENHVIEEL